MPSDFDAVATEGLKTAYGIDDKVQRIFDTQEGVYNKEMDVNNVQNAVQDFGTSVIDGEHVIPNQPLIPS